MPDEGGIRDQNPILLDGILQVWYWQAKKRELDERMKAPRGH